jgi:hypothetical protein
MKLTLSGQTAINLSLAVSEMDIGYQYREFLSRKIQGLTFTSPFKCDGYGEQKNLKIRLLCEFKKDRNLKNRIHFAEVLSQAIYYIKKFELSGLMLPTVILLGDRDEWCVLHTNEVIQYLAMSFNWDVAPSDTLNNKDLVQLIVENDKINPFVFSVNHLDDAIEKIKNLTENVTRLIPITDLNITKVFDYFQKNILGKSTLTTNEFANLFVQILVNPIENYLHPISKVSAIVTKNFNQIPIKNRKDFQSFFEHFKSDYSPREKEVLTSIVDRLVENVQRRENGEFFTSTIWAKKAHEYVSSVFGDDWKEKYVVWDPAWGTGNLTRDYNFKELYASTLNQSDIDTANQMNYNSESTIFQFDFLNDSDEKLPKGLKEAIKNGKEIIFFMNPPYATEANLKVETGNKTKKGIIKNKIAELMKIDDFGFSTKQLYAQFLYRILNYSKNDNIKICLFSPPLFMSGPSYDKFRKKFLNKFGFNKGFLMNAKEFDGTSDWGISFTIWERSNYEKNNFFLNVLERNKFGEIQELDKKIIYNLDGKENLSKNVLIKNKKTVDYPNLSSALSVKKGKTKMIENALGYFLNDSNNVFKNTLGVALFSFPSTINKGPSITNENFMKVITAFSARKLIKPTWKNQKDEYRIPNNTDENYKKFEIDSLVYSLFNNSSQQSSLRQITYKEKLWDIKNEFFWMSKEEMLNLANENSYSDLYNDARTDSDRYVYKLLFGEERIYENLSPDAKLVLDKATELVKKSMSMREAFANDENHLKSWDAGYAQLKLLWKQYYAEDFKEFRELYKNLEDRMRPLVYELGFLMK